jgi:hypothetical protein
MNVSEGYTALWERGRLDLTVEALIHDNPQWHPLFTPEELAICTEPLDSPSTSISANLPDNSGERAYLHRSSPVVVRCVGLHQYCDGGL